MKLPLTLMFSVMLSTPLSGQQLTGVLVNPYTGYVNALIVPTGAKILPEHFAACGPGCEFTDFIRSGQCLVVSVSRRQAAFGYSFGPSDDLPNIKSQAHHYCMSYGGTQCKEYAPICQ